AVTGGGLLVRGLFYRYYFRVKTYGIENLPAGRMLVIGNHAGQIAIDAAMIGTATVLEADPPRPLRGMGEYWLPPCRSSTSSWPAVGGVGTPNCIDILEPAGAGVGLRGGGGGDRFRGGGARHEQAVLAAATSSRSSGTASCASHCRRTRRSCR